MYCSVLPLNPSHQNMVETAADVAEAAASAREASERAQRRDVIGTIRIREVNVLIRIVQIPADLEPHPFPEFPGLRK